jgi:succinate dehydrogenase flavin-adding protein (antitoxin of CptAB toxin-antitoxin module)
MGDNVTPNRDLLIKEVKYRCSYRGTLELDVVCRALLPALDEMDDSELLAIRDLLLNKEGDLMGWLVEGATPPEEWALTVALVRHLFKKSRDAA